MVSLYGGPPLREVEPSHAFADSGPYWFIPPEEGEWPLLLPGDDPAAYAEALRTRPPLIHPIQPSQGEKVGGRSYARRKKGGEEVDTQGEEFIKQLNDAEATALGACLAARSQVRRDQCWRHWEGFCRDISADPILDGTDQRAETRLLCMFAAYQGIILGLSHKTVDVKLWGISKVLIEMGSHQGRAPLERGAKGHTEAAGR